MSEIHHECGVAAVYQLPNAELSKLCPPQGIDHANRLIPRMLLDIQNRGQLSAGITSFCLGRSQLLDTHKDIGTVTEVFRLAHKGKRESLMSEYRGHAAIGHVRYATCGRDDRSYAQPFERHHLQKDKWFSFAFNGQLANYTQLRDELLHSGNHHLARETDTEIIMHELSRELGGDGKSDLVAVMKNVAARFDGAYSLAFLNARGEMIVARDPLGVKPMCYAFDGSLFAAASESVALLNLGFNRDDIKSLSPGTAVYIDRDSIAPRIERFAESSRTAHCFFEWIYFANVASTLDERSVYMARTALGEELARIERERGEVPVDNEDTIVVPVPDTSKAAADAMAYALRVPCREGLIRNRYTGRTFIEGSGSRERAAKIKYTPLRHVLQNKRVILVEDSIVRSTTMRVLLDRIREEGAAKEIHVRVACPPIVAPCFYGIDMSTVSELFAPEFMPDLQLTDEAQARMAKELGADTLRYLPVTSIARAIGVEANELCQGCITGEYPSESGQRLYQVALNANSAPSNGKSSGGRTYEQNPATV
ncbi:MAG: amidophosphoribosyltransferase [Planctomycetales bacterium]|nr:amidophosphoribosyltransferase [Planctomycetales bacterium]